MDTKREAMAKGMRAGACLNCSLLILSFLTSTLRRLNPCAASEITAAHIWVGSLTGAYVVTDAQAEQRP